MIFKFDKTFRDKDEVSEGRLSSWEVIQRFKKAGLSTIGLESIKGINGRTSRDGKKHIHLEFGNDVQSSLDGKVIKFHVYRSLRTLGDDGNYHSSPCSEKVSYYELPVIYVNKAA